MSSKLRRFVRLVILLAVVLVGLRTCMMLLYFLGDNFYAGVGDVGASELAKYADTTQSVDRTPRWSSDGETIVVNIGDYIYAVGTDGEGLRFIPKRISADSKYGVYSPSLSPDGRVAYRLYLEEDSIGFFELITDDEGNYIESAKLDGTDVKRVAYTGDWASNPVWSTDGSRIAFSTSEHGLTTAKPDGWWSDARSWDPSVIGLAGRWSNDGQWVAVVITRDPSSHAHALVIMTWDADGAIFIAAGLGDEPVISLPDWSPSDDRLYFAKKDQATPPPWPTKLYSVNSDGSDLRMIAELGEGFDVNEVDVSPDGSELLFTKHDGVYLINTDGTNLRNITSSYEFTNESIYLDSLAISGTHASASWSPDGSRIAIFYQDEYPIIIDGRVVVLLTMARDGSDIRALITGSPPGPGHGKLLQPTEDPAVVE